MSAEVSKSDFSFEFSGHGHYKVTYTSPITNKQWTKVISNIVLIDKIKNSDKPKKVNLNELKLNCKR